MRHCHSFVFYYFSWICTIVSLLHPAASAARPLLFRQTMTQPSSSSSSSRTNNSKNKPDVGPLPFLLGGRKINFQWQASLNRQRCQASATETSSSKWFYNYLTKKDSKRSIQRVTNKLVSQYPKWLAKPKVTFGLLRATQDDDDDDDDDESITIRPIFFNSINLLTFGPLETLKRRRDHYKVKLPIKGGLLASNDSVNHPNTKDYGCLIFETRVMDDDGATVEKDSYGRTKIICKFESQIAGRYSPWIAGPVPVSFHRKWFYLSSQSVVHAYVMWRFHKLWNHRVTIVC